MSDGARDDDDPHPVPAEASVRCTRCKALLAVRNADGLLVRRAKMQTCITGQSYAVTIVCYRCSTLNVVTGEKK